MATIFNNMATLASAAGSAFVQQQQRPSSSSAGPNTPTKTVNAPSPTSPSASSSSCSSSSCESGVVLSGISFCSSLSNSPTSSTISPTSSVAATNVLSSSANSVSAGLLSASLLAAVSSASTSSTVSMSLQPSICAPTTTSDSVSSLLSSTPTSLCATTLNTSPHQFLLSGLDVTDTNVNVVNSSSLAEDPRALQLALELSMVGLNDTMQLQVHQQQLQLQQIQQQHLQHMQQQHLSQQSQQQQQSSFDMSALSAAVAAAAAAANNQIATTASQLNQFPTALLSSLEDRSKKSQNMTECVPVPSSEHVAEIVGRQGCKIKALRAKTNTYIKTPVRGEEPVFVVTGRKEDVAKAKREILSAAEHFSVIRASRKPSLAGSFSGSLNGTGGCSKSPPGPPSIPGQVTIQVRVPYRVVGLVVGPKGATIKHIQQETQTYIVTPSREKEPIFEVTGLPDNVQAARKQIEAHIALRTGNLATAGESSSTPNCNSVHTINSLSQILNDDVSPEFLASIYKNGICSTFDYADSASGCGFPVVMSNHSSLNPNLTTGSQSLLNSLTTSTSNSFQLQNGIGKDFLNNIGNEGNVENHIFNGGLNITSNIVGISSAVPASNVININVNGVSNNANANGISMSRSCSSASSTTSSKSANNSGGSNSSRPELSNIWKNLGDSLDVDEGIGESPSIWTLPTPLTAMGSHYSPSTSNSPTDSLLGESNTLGQLLMTQHQHRITSDSSNFITQHQHHVANLNIHSSDGDRECLLCGDKDMKTSLLLCGHNMFCMECTKKM